MSPKFVLAQAAVLAGLLVPVVSAQAADGGSYDVVIYGGTSGGIAAAVEAAKLGKTVALIEPTQRIGGLTTNGLSFTDTGNASTIQGLARQFYTDVGKAYGESGAEFKFEPHVALDVYDDWITSTPGISLFTNEKLDLANGVTKSGTTIQSIRTTTGDVFSGKMFIDAGYTGDLMAKSGVTYSVGRESNAIYGEQYNGVQTNAPGSGNHNFSKSHPVSGYVIPGDPSSGLLPGINSGVAANGTGDNHIQSYTYRLTLTKAADRKPWTQPANYNADNYTLLLRQIQANNITKVAGTLLKIDGIKGGKYDLNNQGAFSTDGIGINYAYPDADYATRAQIEQQRKEYQEGLLYFLATDPRLPASIRNEMNSYGLTSDEFTDNGGWSDQIYVREARRMVGPYVMTDQNVLGKRTVSDPVALGSYTMDAHHDQRYVDANGNVYNEGNVQVGVSTPYGISYRALTPQADEATNLLVTGALSASHIAYGSIRMEPVFMELGQAGGAAAALAIDHDTTVQGLDYQTLRNQLIADGMLLNWPDNAAGNPVTLDAVASFNGQTTLPANLNGASTGTGFTGTWTGTGTENVVAGDLTYTRGGYSLTQPAGSPGKVQGNYNARRQNTRALNGALSGAVWMSMLVENPDGTAVSGLSFNPSNNGDPANGTLPNFIVVNGDQLNVTFGGQTKAGITALPVGQTHLILARLEIDPAGNDIIEIWTDPADLKHLGTPDYTLTGQDLFDSLTGVGILSYNPAGPAFSAHGGYVDNLDISNQPTAFTDVTGVTAVPEPASLGFMGIGGMLLLRRPHRR